MGIRIRLGKEIHLDGDGNVEGLLYFGTDYHKYAASLEYWVIDTEYYDVKSNSSPGGYWKPVEIVRNGK